MAVSTPAWKTYPYVLIDGDPELTFPAAEGDQGADSNTFYVAGRLRGRQTQREWSFLVVFAFNDVRKRLRADFFTVALFDLATGDYGTYSEFDLPRLFHLRRGYKLAVGRGSLDVRFASAVLAASRWTTRRDPTGQLLPFSYELSVSGRDAQQRAMHLELEMDTFKPPMPVGGLEYGGIKTCMGQYGTHSYFQSDVRFRGALEWGGVREEVDGDSGWIDRQWTPRYLGTYNDRRATLYRHEWRQLHLDNGVEMSVWLHFDRRRHNRVIPFSGATAAGPQNQVLSTTDFELERLSFVRDPGHVAPRYALTGGAKYFTDRYRLRVPAWDLDVRSEPLVAAPAHAFPIEYWSGPTRLDGTMNGKPVSGIGFHERTLAFCRDFELTDVLRQTLRHLPESSVGGKIGPSQLADSVWEVDGFLSHRDRSGALGHLRGRVRPELEHLDDPHRARVLRIVEDLEATLRQP
jgi:predicted secreted hydrolase